MRPVCAKCKVEMECAKNEVVVWHPIEGKYAHEMMTDAIEGEQIDFVVVGDRYKCSKCGANIVTGFGRMLIATNYDQKGLKEVRDGMEEKIRITRLLHLRGKEQ